MAFLDSDDAYHPDYIWRMVKAISDTNADLSICEYTVCHTVQKMKQSNHKRFYPTI